MGVAESPVSRHGGRGSKRLGNPGIGPQVWCNITSIYSVARKKRCNKNLITSFHLKRTKFNIFSLWLMGYAIATDNCQRGKSPSIEMSMTSLRDVQYSSAHPNLPSCHLYLKGLLYLVILPIYNTWYCQTKQTPVTFH